MILNLEEEMLALLGAIEIVNFREAIDDRRHDYEVAFVEGSITTPEEVEEVREIRERARVLVALGACATLGGINAIKNGLDLHATRRKVYGEMARYFPSEAAKPVRDVVPVDYEMHGCPISKQEFLSVTKTLLLGRVPRQSQRAVCTECKAAANVCQFDKGVCCLGPVARAGCGAICPAYGGTCVACRGMVEDPNLPSMIEIMKSKGMSRREIEDRLTQFNTLVPVDLEPFFTS